LTAKDLSYLTRSDEQRKTFINAPTAVVESKKPEIIVEQPKTAAISPEIKV